MFQLEYIQLQNVCCSWKKVLLCSNVDFGFNFMSTMFSNVLVVFDEWKAKLRPGAVSLLGSLYCSILIIVQNKLLPLLCATFSLLLVVCMTTGCWLRNQHFKFKRFLCISLYCWWTCNRHYHNNDFDLFQHKHVEMHAVCEWSQIKEKVITPSKS